LRTPSDRTAPAPAALPNSTYELTHGNEPSFSQAVFAFCRHAAGTFPSPRNLLEAIDEPSAGGAGRRFVCQTADIDALGLPEGRLDRQHREAALFDVLAHTCKGIPPSRDP